MARGRGRPALTQEEKDRRREQKLAANDQGIADTAMAKLPAEKERRDEFFREGDALKADAQAAAGSISQHKKRGVDVFGITKQAMAIRAILAKCKDGVYEATIKQVGIFVKDMGRPFQLSMFDAVPGTGSVDDAPIFDSTPTGQRHGGNGGAPSASSSDGGPPPAPADSGSLSHDQALAAFEANVDKVLPAGVLKMTDGTFKARPSLAGDKVNLGTFPTIQAAKDAIEAERVRRGLPPALPSGGSKGLGPEAYH